MAATKNTKAFYNTEIPSDWEVAELGKITEKIGDGLHGTPEYINCSEYFFINGNNLKDGTIHISAGTKCVSEEEYLKHKKDLKYKSILLSINGTIGSVAFFKNEKIVLGKSTAYINCKDENVDFLFHYLQSKTVINFFEGELTGSTIRNLSLKSIREIPIPLPPLPEQKAIAQVLSTADAAIHTTEKLIAQKELRKKWLMQQLLTGKKRLKGFGGEWEDVELGELLDYEQPTKYLVSNTLYDDSYSTPVLTAGKTFVLGYTDEEHGICNDLPVVIFDDFTTASKYVDFPFKAKSSAMKLLRPKTNVILKYVFEAMQLMNYAVGGHERHWISKFVYLTVPCPPIEEQTAIAQVLQAADKEINLLKAKVEKLREQKKWLMQVLLTGKKRLNLDSSDFYD
ncbi:MAG: restriction endonuclease subunit S [Sphingobacteriia bacterium]|nr:MAG: restriction endonuclease subunit S [Sphingobacteriia bacterium]